MYIVYNVSIYIYIYTYTAGLDEPEVHALRVEDVRAIEHPVGEASDAKRDICWSLADSNV